MVEFNDRRDDLWGGVLMLRMLQVDALRKSMGFTPSRRFERGPSRVRIMMLLVCLTATRIATEGPGVMLGPFSFACPLAR